MDFRINRNFVNNGSKWWCAKCPPKMHTAYLSYSPHRKRSVQRDLCPKIHPNSYTFRYTDNQQTGGNCLWQITVNITT